MNNNQFTRVLFNIINCIDILDNTESEAITDKQTDEAIKNELIKIKNLIVSSIDKKG